MNYKIFWDLQLR